MKKLIKLNIILLTLTALFIGSKVKAQTTPAMSPAPWRMGIGLETGILTGGQHSVTNWELGGTARLQYDATTSFSVILTSGYYNLFTGNYPGTTTTIGGVTYATSAHSQGIIPVKLGIKDFFCNTMYFSAEGGVGFETQYGENKKLILAPALGWVGNSLDVSIRYENFSGQDNNYGLVGLRIAYGFKL
jgi:hypothetical protein